ncbi:nitroreductase family protein [Kibdelosporangium aridum]|nr:nitroreductase family protein [Kibdelosporangium aridum]
MDLHEAIRGRRTIRKFKPTPVPRDLLAEVMELALWAPSSGGEHEYELVVTRGALRARIQEAVVDQLVSIRADCERHHGHKIAEEIAAFYRDFGGAPVLVFAYAGRLPDGRDDTFGISVAVHNMVLGAHAAGLGTAWAALPCAHSVERAAGLADNGKTLVGIVPVGFPDEETRPVARNDNRVRWIGY